jgi:hypothetical protein
LLRVPKAKADPTAGASLYRHRGFAMCRRLQNATQPDVRIWAIESNTALSETPTVLSSAIASCFVR